MRQEEIIPTLTKIYIYSTFVIKGRVWFKRHCGMRMIKVEPYYEEEGCPGHPERRKGRNILVCSCPDCKYTHQDSSILTEDI